MGFPIHNEFDATLEPGAWQGYNLGIASPKNAFVPAFTPTDSPKSGGFLEKCVIQPEWNGKQWNTVLRLQAPKDAPSAGMKFKVRIYDVSSCPVITDQTVTLNPGQWQGYNLGPSSPKNAFVAAFNPQGSSGGYLETSRFQDEFDGSRWNSVLRLQAPKDAGPMKLNFCVYSLAGAPVATGIDTKVVAGSWPGFNFGQATDAAGYVAALVPKGASSNGAHVFDVMQPEFNGKEWLSAMRIDLPKPQPTISLDAKVYRIGQ